MRKKLQPQVPNQQQGEIVEAPKKDRVFVDPMINKDGVDFNRTPLVTFGQDPVISINADRVGPSSITSNPYYLGISTSEAMKMKREILDQRINGEFANLDRTEGIPLGLCPAEEQGSIMESFVNLSAEQAMELKEIHAYELLDRNLSMASCPTGLVSFTNPLTEVYKIVPCMFARANITEAEVARLAETNKMAASSIDTTINSMTTDLNQVILKTRIKSIVRQTLMTFLQEALDALSDLNGFISQESNNKYLYGHEKDNVSIGDPASNEYPSIVMTAIRQIMYKDSDEYRHNTLLIRLDHIINTGLYGMTNPDKYANPYIRTGEKINKEFIYEQVFMSLVLDMRTKIIASVYDTLMDAITSAMFGYNTESSKITNRRFDDILRFMETSLFPAFELFSANITKQLKMVFPEYLILTGAVPYALDDEHPLIKKQESVNNDRRPMAPPLHSYYDEY